jgi:copper(I)-binding protein
MMDGGAETGLSSSMDGMLRRCAALAAAYAVRHGASMRMLLILVLVAVSTTGASAHDYKHGPLVIEHPWSRATPKGAPVAGGYMKITNTGTAPDRLVGGSTEAAKRFEIHEMSTDGGVMRMRELPNGVEILPGKTIELKPGSSHIMMMNLAKPFVKGERVKASLTFERAGTVPIEFAVDAAGGSPAAGDPKAHKH